MTVSTKTLSAMPLAMTLPVAAALLSPSPGLARPPMHGAGWGAPGWSDPFMSRSAARADTGDPREERVEVSTFAAPDAATLFSPGTAISVEPSVSAGDWSAPAERRVYEAAIENRLVDAGFDTIHTGTRARQTVRLRLVREVLSPAEAKRSPVSGSAAMSVGTRGSAYGLGINVDFTKPRSALVQTRLEARIVDAESEEALWEGRAAIATREDDEDWSDDAIATRLAAALFDGFPKAR